MVRVLHKIHISVTQIDLILIAYLYINILLYNILQLFNSSKFKMIKKIHMMFCYEIRK